MWTAIISIFQVLCGLAIFYCAVKASKSIDRLEADNARLKEKAAEK